MALDIQITAKMIDKWNSNKWLARLMRTGCPYDIQSITSSAVVVFQHFQWISKPHFQKHKNHSKASSGTERFAQNVFS